MSRLALKGCRGPSRAPREPKIHHKVRGWNGGTRSHLPKPSGDQLRLLLLRLSQALDPRPHPEGCRAMSPLPDAGPTDPSFSPESSSHVSSPNPSPPTLVKGKLAPLGEVVHPSTLRPSILAYLPRKASLPPDARGPPQLSPVHQHALGVHELGARAWEMET